MPKRLFAMIAVFSLAGALLLSLTSFAQPSGQNQKQTQQAKVPPKQPTRTVSYALGYDIAQSFSEQSVEIDAQQLFEGLKAGLGEQESRMSEKQISQTLQQFQRRLRAKRMQQRDSQRKQQKQAGDQFLAQNRKKEGVKETDSGLQYKVVEAGSGASPGPKDRVKVHYVGKLVDGKTFDSSRKRGEPVTFRVDRVIPGWSEGLQMMKEGGRYKLFVPPDLGYGERGAGQTIPPNATLVFDVELLKVNPEGQGSQ